MLPLTYYAKKCAGYNDTHVAVAIKTAIRITPAVACMLISAVGGVLINIHTSLTVRVYNIHALQKLDNRIYVLVSK